jgi:beta-lactamase superfamily II metal-dependent hydrolase
MTRDTTIFSVLKAFHGDAIIIKTFNNKNKECVILIDGGTAQTFRYSLKNELTSISKIDIIILTHIDSDHIGGLINFFKSSIAGKIQVGEIWMNYPELAEVESGSLISTSQADNLRNLLTEKYPEVIVRGISCETGVIDYCGVSFTILSPDRAILNELYRQWKDERPLPGVKAKQISKESAITNESFIELASKPFRPKKTIDNDIYNASSISFILQCPDISVLFLADSRPEIITEKLAGKGYSTKNQLHVDFVKIAHHGSLNNTSIELLQMVKSKNFIISTNGGSATHCHPSRETLARIVHNPHRSDEEVRIFFNYPLEEIFKRNGELISHQDLSTGNWKPVHQNNFTVNDL